MFNFLLKKNNYDLRFSEISYLVIDFFTLRYAFIYPTGTIMNSLYKQCTELKQKYDSCYSTWFTEKFLKGDTDEGMCAPIFKLYQHCLKMDDCRELKEKYEACFNYWFPEKFLKGDHNDEMCASLLKVYTECVRKAMKENKIEIKEMENSHFDLENDIKNDSSSNSN